MPNVRSGRRTGGLPVAIRRKPGRSDLVNEMEIDVEQCRLVLSFTDDMRLPEFFEKGHNRSLVLGFGLWFLF